MNRSFNRLKKILSLIPKDYILSPAVELGSGSGILSVTLKKLFKDLELTAIDKDLTGMSSYIKRRYRKYGIILKEADITTTEIASNSISTIFIYQLLRHLPENQLDIIFHKIHNILRDNGYFIIIESLLPIFKKAQKNFLQLQKFEASIDHILGKQPECYREFNDIVSRLHKSGFIILMNKKLLATGNKISRRLWNDWKKQINGSLKLVRKRSKTIFKTLAKDLRLFEKNLFREGLEQIPLTVIVCQKINFEQMIPHRKDGTKLRQENENTYLMMNIYGNQILLVNKMAFYIFSLIDGKSSCAQIIKNIAHKFGADKIQVNRDVIMTLSNFIEANLIEFKNPAPPRNKE